jgi:hypothetical protein
MSTKVFVKLVFAAVFVFSNSLWASKKSRAIRYGTMVGQQTGDSISNNSQANAGVNSTEYDSIKQSSVDNLNNGQKGQTVAYLMAGGLAVAAARHYGMCSGWNLAACAAGAVLAAMALSANKSGKSFNTPNADSWNNVCQYSSSGCSGAAPNPYNAAVDVVRTSEDLIKVEKMNKSKGVSVDTSSGLVKLPNGKEMNLNDPASMSAVMGSQNTSKLLSEVKGIEQEAMRKVEQIQPTSLEAAYGMGNSGMLAGPGYDLESDDSVNSNLEKAANARKPAQVNGLTKNFNGDPIGVSGDSIFGMMSRRYKLKSNQKSFFGPEL